MDGRRHSRVGSRHLASFVQLAEELYPARALKPNRVFMRTATRMIVAASSSFFRGEEYSTICLRFWGDIVFSRNYFKKPSRRSLLGGIIVRSGGFYVAQTISLSLGALGVNNVIAAVLCVLSTRVCEKVLL